MAANGTDRFTVRRRNPVTVAAALEDPPDRFSWRIPPSGTHAEQDAPPLAQVLGMPKTTKSPLPPIVSQRDGEHVLAQLFMKASHQAKNPRR